MNKKEREDDVNEEDSNKELIAMSSIQESPITAILNESEESKELDFLDLRSHKIRISKRNRIMKQQLNIDCLDESYISFFSQENFERLIQKQLDNQKPIENNQNIKLEPGSCFF